MLNLVTYTATYVVELTNRWFWIYQSQESSVLLRSTVLFVILLRLELCNSVNKHLQKSPDQFSIDSTGTPLIQLIRHLM